MRLCQIMNSSTYIKLREIYLISHKHFQIMNFIGDGLLDEDSGYIQSRFD